MFFRIIALNILKDSVLRNPSHENPEEEIVLDDVTQLFQLYWVFSYVKALNLNFKSGAEIDPLSPWSG